MARLALPIAVVQVGTMTMGVVDTIMVGRISAVDLAAVALGHIHYFSVTIFGLGILLALDPILAQGIGAGDGEAVARGVQRGGILAVIIGTISALLLLPGAPILTFFRQPEDVVPIAAGYAIASIPGAFPFYGFLVLRQSLQAMRRTGPIVITILCANGANAFFNWVFVFGNLGISPMGAVGSGWASSLARWLMAIALLLLSWKDLRPYLRPLRPEIFRLPPLLRLLRLGFPIGVQVTLEFGAFAVIAIFMGWLGTIAVAGHQIAINLASLTFMVPLGIAQASAVLVGHAVGRGDSDEAQRAAAAGIVLGASFMVVSAIIFLSFPHALARIYSSVPEVVALASVLIPVAGVFQIFDGLQVVESGVLRGVGDTKSPMIVNGLGFWMIGLPVSLLLGFQREGGPVGLWWGLASGLAVVAFLLFIQVRIRLKGVLLRVEIEEER